MTGRVRISKLATITGAVIAYRDINKKGRAGIVYAAAVATKTSRTSDATGIAATATRVEAAGQGSDTLCGRDAALRALQRNRGVATAVRRAGTRAGLTAP